MALKLLGFINSDFTRFMNNRLMTPSMQQQLMGYFQISFVTDPSIDLICAEAFQPTRGGKNSKTPHSSPTKPKKRAKNYNTPVVCTSCDNCDEKEMRFKPLKSLRLVK